MEQSDILPSDVTYGEEHSIILILFLLEMFCLNLIMRTESDKAKLWVILQNSHQIFNIMKENKMKE